MTDLTIPLVALSLGGAGLAAFDLARSDMRDVVGAIGMLPLGLVLGGILQIILPGGVLLGAVGGAALASTRLGDIRRSRLQTIEEEIDAADTPVERLVLLHARLDRIHPETDPLRRLVGRSAAAFLSLLAGLLLLGGLTSGVGSLFVLGGLLAAAPAVSWAGRTIRAEERRLLERALTALEDEAAGVLPEGTVERPIRRPGVP